MRMNKTTARGLRRGYVAGGAALAVAAALVLGAGPAGASTIGQVLSETAGTGDFGISIASTGNQVVIGSYDSNVVHTYTLNPNTGKLTLNQTIPAPSANDAGFGAAVAISGTTMAVGDPFYYDTSVGNFVGAVMIYTGTAGFNGVVSNWSLSTTFVSPDLDNYSGFGSEFGASLALSANQLAVGSPAGQAFTGAVWLYDRTTHGWAAEQPLGPSDTGVGYEFGRSVSMSGNLLVVGAPATVGGYAGRAYVYQHSTSGAWIQTAELTEQGAGGHFGYATSVLSTGSIAVTAPGHGTGSVFFFSLNSKKAWALGSTLVGPSANPGFGWSISASTSLLTVGANGGYADSHKGSIVLYTKGLAGWHQIGSAVAPDASANSDFGYTVDVTGTTVLVDAPFRDDGQGAVYVVHG